jgi:endonuclease YncB( thermonuclease family)
MPFTLIKGRFKPAAGTPDGDSVRFLADNLSLWSRLEGRPVRLGTGVTTKNTAQLRFEGIDSIEKGATQPLADQSRDNMFRLIGHTPAVAEPRGYVLARMTDDQSGRPICFAYAGGTTRGDGSEVFLDLPLLRRSVNYQQMRDGFAYPLYYNTLFAALREQFDVALALAKQQRRGYWPTDATRAGVTIRTAAELKTIRPIWPKLWRRLEEYLGNNPPPPNLSGFVEFLATQNERVDILSLMEERGLQDLVRVNGNRVRLLFNPENLRVVGQAGLRRR